VGDFFAKPGGLGEGFVFALEFDLRNNEACIVAKELIDFPGVAFVLYAVASLLDQAAFTVFQEKLGVVGWDLIFKLG
jgi:NADH:ubiquinone oxidoreductase subunit H